MSEPECSKPSQRDADVARRMLAYAAELRKDTERRIRWSRTHGYPVTDELPVDFE